MYSRNFRRPVRRGVPSSVVYFLTSLRDFKRDGVEPDSGAWEGHKHRVSKVPSSVLPRTGCKTHYYLVYGDHKTEGRVGVGTKIDVRYDRSRTVGERNSRSGTENERDKTLEMLRHLWLPSGESWAYTCRDWHSLNYRGHIGSLSPVTLDVYLRRRPTGSLSVGTL